MEDLKLRDRLEALADDMASQTSVPAGLLPRARRRAAFVVGATLVCLLAASVGLVAGLRAVLRSQPVRPAVPSPTSPAELAGDLLTVMLVSHDGALPTGAALVDPDGEPSGASVLRIGRWGIPLGWAPGGERLLFTLPTGGLFVREPDGTVAELAVTAGFWGAAWSPDGSQIVFGRGLGDRTSLYLIDADGTDERVLLEAAPDERFLYPSWSPTGTRIAYLRTSGFVPAATRGACDARCQREGDRDAELWSMRVDGSYRGPVVPDGSVHPRAYSYNPPAWSPDARHLAFAAYVGTGPGDIQIVIADLTGFHTQVTTGSGDALAPAWSPDGIRIAFIREIAGTYDLRMAFADGSEERSMMSLGVPAVYEASSVLWTTVPTV